MRKFLILTTLVFLVLVSSGCTPYQQREVYKQGRDLVENVVTNAGTSGASKGRDLVEKVTNAGTSGASKGASRSIKNFIKQAGNGSGKRAGNAYINQQIASHQPVSRKTLTEVITSSIIKEVKKTGQQVSRAMVQKEAIAIASVLLSQNEDKAEVVEEWFLRL